MAILGIAPGREVGEAYRFLLELRIDEGPLGPERAEEALRTWWAARVLSRTSLGFEHRPMSTPREASTRGVPCSTPLVLQHPRSWAAVAC